MKKPSFFAAIILIVASFVCGTANPSWAGYEMEINEQTKGEIGFWGQTWYQWVEDGKGEESQNDFILRRAYFYLKGQVTDYVGFFTHIASDKVGQEGLDDSSLGLGSGVAWRDLWVSFNLHEAFKIQFGRMYVPLTRNYGTTSTKCMLTLDLPFLQGGSRGGIFYAQKVGRDDSLVVWGNPIDGHLQYRFMIGEGVEGAKTSPTGVVVSDNPKDNLRFAGRLSVSLLEPETGWFNKGTYLGEKKVLSFGVGMDTQKDLVLNDVAEEDNFVWTADVFFDHPAGNGAFTLEAAYIDIDNCTQTQPQAYTDLAAGDDATNWYFNLGYLINNVGPGGLQPYFRYETVDVDNKHATDFISGGLNYYLKGHNAKITVDYMHVEPDNPEKTDRGIFTVQAAVGF